MPIKEGVFLLSDILFFKFLKYPQSNIPYYQMIVAVLIKCVNLVFTTRSGHGYNLLCELKGWIKMKSFNMSQTSMKYMKFQFFFQWNDKLLQCFTVYTTKLKLIRTSSNFFQYLRCVLFFFQRFQFWQKDLMYSDF